MCLNSPRVAGQVCRWLCVKGCEYNGGGGPYMRITHYTFSAYSKIPTL